MKQLLLNDFKQKLLERHVFGLFSKTSDSSFIEIAGHAGFNYIIIDLEHSTNTYQIAQNHVRAAENISLIPIIRIPEINEKNISTALDLGAYGIQVPKVDTARDAESVVKYAKFHPLGERGVCRFVREADFSKKNKNYFFEESNDALIIVHIEGDKALKNLDNILDVNGIDIIFVGPYDLSQSLGCPGEISSPVVIDAMVNIIEKAQSKSIITGTFVDSPESLSFWKDKGVRYLSYSVDVGIFYDACKNIVELG
tara:strand:- start:1807 stop:2568 length:762 start_codon:yes stop_codon:yes gene_type:complete